MTKEICGPKCKHFMGLISERVCVHPRRWSRGHRYKKSCTNFESEQEPVIVTGLLAKVGKAYENHAKKIAEQEGSVK